MIIHELCDFVHSDSESQSILIETLQQEKAKFAECQAIEEVTLTVR